MPSSSLLLSFFLNHETTSFIQIRHRYAGTPPLNGLHQPPHLPHDLWWIATGRDPPRFVGTPPGETGRWICSMLMLKEAWRFYRHIYFLQTFISTFFSINLPGI